MNSLPVATFDVTTPYQEFAKKSLSVALLLERSFVTTITMSP